MATTLYVIAFVAIPVVVVILLLGFDQVRARAAVAKPHHVWSLVAVTPLLPMFIRGAERDFGVSFWLHGGAAAMAIAFAVNERFRLARR